MANPLPNRVRSNRFSGSTAEAVTTYEPLGFILLWYLTGFTTGQGRHGRL